MLEIKSNVIGKTILGIFVGAVFAVSLALFLTPSGFAKTTGIVISSGSISSSGLDGGTIEIARVRLANGQEVNARTQISGTLSPGQDVTIFVEDRFFGGALYTVTSRGTQVLTE